MNVPVITVRERGREVYRVPLVTPTSMRPQGWRIAWLVLRGKWEITVRPEYS